MTVGDSTTSRKTMILVRARRGAVSGRRAKRSKGKQPGAAGVNLAWTDIPDERADRFPEGRWSTP